MMDAITYVYIRGSRCCIHVFIPFCSSASECMRGFISDRSVSFGFHDPAGSYFVIETGDQYFTDKLSCYLHHISTVIKINCQLIQLVVVLAPKVLQNQTPECSKRLSLPYRVISERTSSSLNTVC